MAEIDQVDKYGQLSDSVTFAEASKMQYLQACMKEAMRIHPAVGQLLERVVPPEGGSFGDSWLPGGTIVGINPWVAGRENSVYGDDVDAYRPERWLAASPDQLKLIPRNYLAVRQPSLVTLFKFNNITVWIRRKNLYWKNYFIA